MHEREVSKGNRAGCIIGVLWKHDQSVLSVWDHEGEFHSQVQGDINRIAQGYIPYQFNSFHAF